MENYYNIAGLTVKMDCSGRTAQQAQAYRCAPVERPDIQIEWNSEDILGPGWADADPELVEYMSVGFEFNCKLLLFNGLMIHASAVVVDEKAYLFSANSGTGKSTHTKLWLQEFGDRAYILNDDKPAIRLEDGIWYAYGTPFSGKHDLSVDKRVPLGGIAILERGEKNEIEPFSGVQAIRALLDQTVRPWHTKGRILLMDLLDQLLGMTKVWKIKCTMDPEAAHVAYEAMSGE